MLRALFVGLVGISTGYLTYRAITGTTKDIPADMKAAGRFVGDIRDAAKARFKYAQGETR